MRLQRLFAVFFSTLLTLFCVAPSTDTFAQATAQIPKGLNKPAFQRPYSMPANYEATGYMLNLTNPYAYLNVIPFAANYKDTVTTSSGTYTLYLTSAIGGGYATPVVTPYVAVDTFVPFSLPTIGALSISLQGSLISGTVTGTAVLEMSYDNSTWFPYKAGTTAGNDTLIFSSTSLRLSWFTTLHPALYYRIKLVFTSSTQSTSWVSQWYIKSQYYDVTQH